MADYSKQYPVTEQRLFSLREEGLYAGTWLVWFAGVVVACGLWFPMRFKVLESYIFLMSIEGKEILLNTSDKESLTKFVNSSLLIVFKEVVYFLGFVFVIVVLFGLIQSKFMFSPKLLSFDTKRFSLEFSKRQRQQVKPRFLTSFLLMLLFALVVFSTFLYRVGNAAFFERSYIPLKDNLITYENLDKVETRLLRIQELVSYYSLDINIILGVALFLICVFVILGYIGSRVAFFRENMMSKGEIDAEYYESEMSPALRQQLNQRAGDE